MSIQLSPVPVGPEPRFERAAKRSNQERDSRGNPTASSATVSLPAALVVSSKYVTESAGTANVCVASSGSGIAPSANTPGPPESSVRSSRYLSPGVYAPYVGHGSPECRRRSVFGAAMRYDLASSEAALNE